MAKRKVLAPRKAPAKTVKRAPALAKRRTTTAVAKAAPSLELAPVAAPSAAGLSSLGLSRLKLTDREHEALMAPFGDDAHEILPTGEVYIPHVWYRKRLTDVFGPTGHGLSGGEPKREGNAILREWVLLIRGVAVGSAWGEGSYKENNRRDKWSNATEASQSHAVSRICGKHLCLAPYLWSSRWQFRYRMQNGVFVDVRDRHGEIMQEWRHVDAEPRPGEVGINDASPNQDRYQAPTQARRAAASATPYRGGAGDDAGGAAASSSRSTSLVPANDAAIGSDPRPHRQIRHAMRASGVTEAAVKAHIRSRWGYGSTKDLRRSQVEEVIGWVKSPARLRGGEDEPLEADYQVVP